jgi:hypothetical protein
MDHVITSSFFFPLKFEPNKGSKLNFSFPFPSVIGSCFFKTIFFIFKNKKTVWLRCSNHHLVLKFCNSMILINLVYSGFKSCLSVITIELYKINHTFKLTFSFLYQSSSLALHSSCLLF